MRLTCRMEAWSEQQWWAATESGRRHSRARGPARPAKRCDGRWLGMSRSPAPMLWWRAAYRARPWRPGHMCASRRETGDLGGGKCTQSCIRRPHRQRRGARTTCQGAGLQRTVCVCMRASGPRKLRGAVACWWWCSSVCAYACPGKRTWATAVSTRRSHTTSTAPCLTGRTNRYYWHRLEHAAGEPGSSSTCVGRDCHSLLGGRPCWGYRGHRGAASGSTSWAPSSGSCRRHPDPNRAWCLACAHRSCCRTRHSSESTGCVCARESAGSWAATRRES